MVDIPRTISENETKSILENWQIAMKLPMKNIPLVMFNKNSDKAFLSDIFYRINNEICSAGNFQ